ncbi:F-box domain-containing protein [Artemisia annua]|uniref:F-box domain-containing protein n=1 Tax=Artemisia annua TaxID=35608 RepID=A0A2U1M2E7_ARTAN|nr:F-box domain-containing protein [Artemisia annua]
MADVHISDHILYNIFTRLPAESLLRFRCASKHWNSLIKDPYLMKLRSLRPMILLPCKSLFAIDDNSIVEISVNPSSIGDIFIRYE